MLLLDLPDEILSHILQSCSHFTDSKGRLGPSAPGRQDILNLGRTCQKAYGIAEPFLLRSILLRQAKHATTFTSLLQSDGSGKAKHVKDLALVPLAQEISTDFRQVAKVLAKLRNLEHLLVEVPYRSQTTDGKDPWEAFQDDLANLDHAAPGIPGYPFPNWAHRLTTCHLNFQSIYGTVSSLNNLEFVVFAPRLQHLTLVDAHIDGLSQNGVKISPSPHGSPIRSLSLESCSFSLRGISQLLSLPTALRSLHYYPHNVMIDHDSGRAGILGLLAHALSSLATYQRHSLTDLAIHFEGLAELRSYESSTPLASHISLNRLAHLTNLKIKLSEYDALTTDSISNLFPRLPPSIVRLHIEDKHRATEYPQLLAICRALLKPLNAPEFVQSKSSTAPQAPLPRLTHLTICFTPYWESMATPLPPHVPLDLAASFAEQGHLLRHRFRPLRSHHVHLTVIRRTEIITAIPPYLWDEDQPENILVYDNMTPEDMWNTTTQTETERFKEMKRQVEENRRRHEAMVALAQQQAQEAEAQATNAAAQQTAQQAVLEQAAAFAAQMDGAVTVVASVGVAAGEEGLVQEQTNSA